MGTNKKKAQSRPAGEGERAARRGYVHQDRSSARLIYEAIVNRTLMWVGLADRSAGIADDLVLGLSDAVVAHQFKRSRQPASVGITALLLGEGGTIAELAAAYTCLRKQFPRIPIRLRYLTNDYPSKNDQLIKGKKPSNTAEFLDEHETHPRRTLAEWRATRWKPVINALVQRSCLSDLDFESFWMNFDLVVGSRAIPAFDICEDKRKRDQIEELARALSTLVADNGQTDRWSRAELLAAVGWPDRFSLRFTHTFPVGAYVQRNEATEGKLSKAITAYTRGYLSLVGPPGAGKSTLLQRVIRDQPRLHVIRYLAFVPGTAQGQGRGEADSFYDDVNCQLASTNLKLLRLKDDSTRARQQQFEHLLARAGDRHVNDGTRYIIVIDGLDHISREEHPDRSLLTALPLPQAVPDGVLFLLGTQRLDLHDMPAAVQQDAEEVGRRIDIAPLSERAVAAMADALGLPSEVDRQALYGVTRGHPLVTRYLIERLIVVEASQRDSLLNGEMGFGGDLQSVYDAAWRSVEQADDSTAVKQVLALIAHAQGAIEPELLAKATSDEAVESALRNIGHLLDVSDGRWTMFHNSFRLYLHLKRVEKFGKADPDFVPQALYRKLADLTALAALGSPQRWLRFRYLFLANKFDEALAVADRTYFVSQYNDGRSSRAVRGDIVDAYRALKTRMDAVKLFDLMLADDEVHRRATIMEGVTSVVDAYLAIGDLDAAYAALADHGENGKQWLVTDAFLRQGLIEQARQIFDQENPFRPPSHHIPGTKGVFSWARRAVLFLDNEQLEQYISEGIDNRDSRGDEDAADRESLLKNIKFQIARAAAGASMDVDVERIIARWSVDPNDVPMLLIEAADRAFEEGEHERVRLLVTRAADHAATTKLHASWLQVACRLAVKIGEYDVAKRLITHVPLEGLGVVEKANKIEEMSPACRGLVAGIAVRATIGLPIPKLTTPDERLLKGAQHHLVAIASAIGAVRGGKPIGEGEIQRLSSAAIKFLAVANVSDDDDWFTSYLMPPIAEVVGEALFKLLEIARVNIEETVHLIEDFIASGKAAFRWWPQFRRVVAVRAFHINQDADAALSRLEAGLADLSVSDPSEELEEKTKFAIAMAEIGAIDKARAVISELRGKSLGMDRPAKKDGQYHLWVDTLANANAVDPKGRQARAAVALQLVDGLKHSEARNMAWRIGRQVLFEATASDACAGWSAATWAAGTGVFSWDGIIDATLRGLLAQSLDLAEPALIAWSHLCLPWYGEPHGSTTETGQFLKELIARAENKSLARIEQYAAEAIALVVQPVHKRELLRILQEEGTKWGSGKCAEATAKRWEGEQCQDTKVDPENRSYRHLIDFAGISEAIAAEETYYNSQSTDSSGRHVTYSLRRAAIRVIASSSWTEVSAFAREHQDFMSEPDVAMAAARVAVAAGRKAEASALVSHMMDEQSEGWSWSDGRGRLRFHEIRRLLGEPDGIANAQLDFIDDIAVAKYGVSATLWSIDEIFPLLFEEVPWPQMWDQLAAQIQSMRDFRLGNQVSPLTGVVTDSELIAELFCWALTFGIPLLHDQASRGAIALLNCGYHAIVIKIIERLLDRGAEPKLLGMELLLHAIRNNNIANHFKGRLAVLAEDSDIGVSAAATFLANRWHTPVHLMPRDLPQFYQLHLPDPMKVRGHVASDQRTRGMVLEDPLGWTEAWMSVVKHIARVSDVSIEHIRRRAGQFVSSWGGVEKFGHAASIRIENDLKMVSLKMTYRRPQTEVSLRALRYVTCELWRAGRIGYRDFRALAYELWVDPDRPALPNPETRPSRVHIPAVPQTMWGEKQVKWLDEVMDDLSYAGDEEERVLAEWSVVTTRKIRVTASSERWCAINQIATEPTRLDEYLDDLPRIIRIGTAIPLYDEDGIHSSRTVVFDPHMLQGEPRSLLVLCPLTAAQLGWSSDQRAVHIYRDGSGQEMAWTQWWRDGLPQPVDEDEQRAEGQRVILSAEGCRQFENRFGPIRRTTLAWRRVEASKGDGTPGVRFATNTA